MNPIFLLKMPASAEQTRAAAPVSVARRTLDEALRSFSAETSQVPAWAKDELNSLKQEGVDELLTAGLLRVAGRLQSQNRLEAAASLFHRLAGSQISEESRNKAAAELSAMSGSGDFGRRAEFLLSRFFEDSTDLRTILPWTVASFLGQAAGSLALGRMLASTSRGCGNLPGMAWMARLGAASIGYMAEVSAFNVFSRAFSRNAPGPWTEDLARVALSLGAFRLAGWAGSGLGLIADRSLFLAISPISNIALHQGAALAGLMAAHGLEEWFGLRPSIAGGNLFFESLASLISMNVGAQLGRGALGRRFFDIQSEMNFRSRPTSKRESPPFFPQLAGIEGNPGEVSRKVSDPVEFLGPERVMMSGKRGKDDGGKIEHVIPVSYNSFIDPKTPLRIGRAPDNTIVISHPEVSDYHAEIDFTSHPDILVRDLNSRTGTYVRNIRLSPGASENLRSKHLRIYFGKLAVGPVEITVQLPPTIEDYSEVVLVKSVDVKGERWAIKHLSLMNLTRK